MCKFQGNIYNSAQKDICSNSLSLIPAVVIWPHYLENIYIFPEKLTHWEAIILGGESHCLPGLTSVWWLEASGSTVSTVTTVHTGQIGGAVLSELSDVFNILGFNLQEYFCHIDFRLKSSIWMIFKISFWDEKPIALTSEGMNLTPPLYPCAPVNDDTILPPASRSKQFKVNWKWIFFKRKKYFYVSSILPQY